MSLISVFISSGRAVRTTCLMRKEATPETLCTLLPPLLRRSRKQMQSRKSATPTQPVPTSSSQPACRTASLHVTPTQPMEDNVDCRRESDMLKHAHDYDCRQQQSRRTKGLVSRK